MSAGSVAGLAGLVIGEIEGSPAGVHQVAASWRQAAAAVSEGAALVGSAQAVVASWQGQGAEAFGASASGLQGDTEALTAGLVGGAGALEAYASVLEAAQHAATGLRAQAESLVDSALGNPLAAGPAAAGLASLAATYQALRAEVHHAATQAATTLG
ncbi:hypothetical protein D4740_12665, partial [Actinomyces sp. 2119]